MPLGEERDSKTIKEQSRCGKRCPAYMKTLCEQPNPTAREVRREQGSAIVYQRIGPGTRSTSCVPHTSVQLLTRFETSAHSSCR